MPTNIEIKARVVERRAMEKRAAALSDSSLRVIRQEDVFFNVRKGRLKLRFFGPRRGELIFYEREDSVRPKPSDYVIFPTNRPKELREALARALGVAGVVRKTRHLYLAGNTRIHLDEVEGLGHFLELEVVLSRGQKPREGRQIAVEARAATHKEHATTAQMSNERTVVRLALKAAAAYFSGVFLAGFVLGSLRVFVVVPRIGPVLAVALEFPLMLAVSWIVCGWVVRRFAVPGAIGIRMALGFFAFVLLMLAETLLALATGRTLATFSSSLAEAEGLLGLSGQVILALLPLVRRNEKKPPL